MTDQTKRPAQSQRKAYARPMLIKREKLGQITAMPAAPSQIIVDGTPG